MRINLGDLVDRNKDPDPTAIINAADWESPPGRYRRGYRLPARPASYITGQVILTDGGISDFACNHIPDRPCS